MKIRKRMLGILLTLVLILQCGQGIVIGKAEAVAITPVNSANLEIVDLDLTNPTANGNQSVYSFKVRNSGSADVEKYIVVLKYNFNVLQTETFEGKLKKSEEKLETFAVPNSAWGSVTTQSIAVYEGKTDSRISTPNYERNQWGNGKISFTTVARSRYKLTFLDNDGAIVEKSDVAATSSVSLTLTQDEHLNNGTLLSYEIVETYGATEYTAVPAGISVSAANLPTINLAPYNGGPFINPNAGGVAATDALQYTVEYVDADGSKTASFAVSNKNGQFWMSDASWYKEDNSIIITKWTITKLIKFSSVYSWMQLGLSSDGNSYTVTNTSNNNVTSFEVNEIPINEELGLNQTSTQPLPAANNGIVTVNLNKATYVSVAAMYPDANALWFVPTNAQMSEDAPGSYRMQWSVANTSTDYRVNSFNLSFHYRLGGADKYSNITISDAIEAQGTKSSGHVVASTANQSFEFVELTIQNVNYTKDIDPALEHTALSGPTMKTSSLNYKTYVTWSLVDFGNYRLSASGSEGPIEWRVLEYDQTNDTLTLMANKALFSMAYEPTMFGSTWDSCSLRTYLNGTFMNEAFTKQQRDAIFNHFCDNSASGSSHSVGGTNTYDYVYVLSVAELNDPKYGLYGGDATNSVIETRQFEATDYALSNTNLTKKTYAGQTFVNYYLRTPGYYQYDVAGVAPSGILNASGWRTYTKTAAVCPVITVSYGAAQKAGLTWKGSVYKQVPAGYNTAAAKSVKATPTKKLKALSIGDTKTVNNVTYEVTKTTNKSKTVAVAGVKKSAKKVVIPSTVKMNGATYKVTKIKANAFKKAKGNLKTITIKSKNITTMNKKAFAGLTKKTTVKISKGQYKKYKKLIKNDKLTVKKY